jgi:hypothetical protein
MRNGSQGGADENAIRVVDGYTPVAGDCRTAHAGGPDTDIGGDRCAPLSNNGSLPNFDDMPIVDNSNADLAQLLAGSPLDGLALPEVTDLAARDKSNIERRIADPDLRGGFDGRIAAADDDDSLCLAVERDQFLPKRRSRPRPIAGIEPIGVAATPAAATSVRDPSA